MLLKISILFFFFQAEDGIRDLTVTGVQTCALPISAFTDDLEHADIAGPRHVCATAKLHGELAEAQHAHVLLVFLAEQREDRKSTRLNSSHSQISYAVFCLKKKKKKT